MTSSESNHFEKKIVVGLYSQIESLGGQKMRSLVKEGWSQPASKFLQDVFFDHKA